MSRLLLLLPLAACADDPPAPLTIPPAVGGWFGPLAAEQAALKAAEHITLQGTVAGDTPCTGALRVELREAPGAVDSGLVTAVEAIGGTFTLLAPRQEGLLLTAACDQARDGAPTPGTDQMAPAIPVAAADAQGLTLSLSVLPGPEPAPPADGAPLAEPPPAGTSGILESAPRLGDPKMMRRRGTPGLRPPSLGSPSGGTL